MKKLGFITAFCFITLSYSQSIPNEGKSINDFVPSNWKIIEKAEGDLNKDKKQDVVLIIENTNPSNIHVNNGLGEDSINTNPRYLLILFKNENGYELKEINKTFVPTQGDLESPCLVDPLSEGGIEIKKGVFILRLNYWASCGSWITIANAYTFRYQNNEFELIGFDSTEFHRNSGENSSVSINFSTKKMSITTGENEFEEGSTGDTEWKRFKIKKLKNLKNLNVPMEWEFMGIYI